MKLNINETLIKEEEAKMKEYNLNICVYQAEDKKWWVWIGNENGTGGEYPANNPKELGEAISFYISAYCQS